MLSALAARISPLRGNCCEGAVTIVDGELGGAAGRAQRGQLPARVVADAPLSVGGRKGYDQRVSGKFYHVAAMSGNHVDDLHSMGVQRCGMPSNDLEPDQAGSRAYHVLAPATTPILNWYAICLSKLSPRDKVMYAHTFEK